MRGFVELSKQNGMDIIDKCLNVLKTYKGRYEPKTRWNMFRFGYNKFDYFLQIPVIGAVGLLCGVVVVTPVIYCGIFIQQIKEK